MIGDAENLSQSLSISVNHPPHFRGRRAKISFLSVILMFQKSWRWQFYPRLHTSTKEKEQKSGVRWLL